jgi:hypothetical protein
MSHQKVTIGGKDVYIVESHHHVLQGWAEVRRSQGSALALLTLDHHTDTKAPFFNHRFWETHKGVGNDNQAAMQTMLPGMIAAIDWNDEDTVVAAIANLKHDEHIRTAIQAGIVSRAFVVNLSGENRADAQVYETCSGCDAIGCTKPIHDHRCAQTRVDQVLESTYLDHELGKLNTMAQARGVPGAEAAPYILDIDLDYFHSEKAIDPDDAATFYRLVQGALAITIAIEARCVKSLRCSGSKITGQSLLTRMQQHMQTALT